MKIKSLTIENYRAISSLSFSLDRPMTIIIGRNGAGKTTVLDALASVLMMATAGPNLPQPLRNDDRKIPDGHATIMVEVETEELPEQFRLKKLTQSTESGDNQFLVNTRRASAENPSFVPTKPFAVYYKQDRGFENPALLHADPGLLNPLAGQLQAISQLEKWWDLHDADEARQIRDRNDLTYRDPQLEIIRKLIKEIEGFDGISFRAVGERKGLFFKKRISGDMHVNQLSTGERAFLILLADLARRLQLHFGGHELGALPGIVLIDEIELNLHPQWQSRIITTLRTVFRSCQFIITTHSPQVISAIESPHVFILSQNAHGGHDAKHPLNTKGRSSDYLLDGVFFASERLPEVDQLMDAVNDAIDDSRVEEARLLLAKLAEQIEGRAPELLVLERRLKKAEGGL